MNPLFAFREVDREELRRLCACHGVNLEIPGDV